jgi:DNA-binding MarR family transcriptional regulator
LIKPLEKKYISPKNPNLDTWLWFRRTYMAISKARQKELRTLGISIPESAVIFVVHEANDRVTPTEISRQLLLDIHSISQLLDRMEKRGLIEKINDLPRKNMIRVALTPEGRKLYKYSIKEKSITNCMSALTDTEKQRFKLYLDKIRIKAMVNQQ